MLSLFQLSLHSIFPPSLTLMFQKLSMFFPHISGDVENLLVRWAPLSSVSAALQGIACQLRYLMFLTPCGLMLKFMTSCVLDRQQGPVSKWLLLQQQPLCTR